MKLATLAVALIVAIAAMPSHAAQYPERPIRVVVPFAPGGNVDLNARAITGGMAEALGVTVVVDNRAGAGGAVGAEIVANASPDGYTLLVGSTGLLTIAPAIFPKLRYDPIRDFAPIALISEVPLVMIVAASSRARTVKEFIALAKASPRELNMASSGNFSTGQLAGALFQQVAGIKLVHVPYKGASPALVDLIGGQVEVMFDQVSSAIGHIRGGRVRPLAVTSTKRITDLADVPTMSEAGVAGVEAGTFAAILAPARTPRAIVGRLNDAVSRTLATKATRETFAKLGAEVMASTPESSAAHIKSELAKWSKVIRAAGLKAE